MWKRWCTNKLLITHNNRHSGIPCVHTVRYSMKFFCCLLFRLRRFISRQFKCTWGLSKISPKPKTGLTFLDHCLLITIWGKANGQAGSSARSRTGEHELSQYDYMSLDKIRIPLQILYSEFLDLS